MATCSDRKGIAVANDDRAMRRREAREEDTVGRRHVRRGAGVEHPGTGRLEVKLLQCSHQASLVAAMDERLRRPGSGSLLWPRRGRREGRLWPGEGCVLLRVGAEETGRGGTPGRRSQGSCPWVEAHPWAGGARTGLLLGTLRLGASAVAALAVVAASAAATERTEISPRGG